MFVVLFGGIFAMFYAVVAVSMSVFITILFTVVSSATGLGGSLLRRYFIGKPLRVLLKSLDNEIAEKILIDFLIFMKEKDKKRLILNLFTLVILSISFVLLKVFPESQGVAYTLLLIGTGVGAYTFYLTFIFNKESAEIELYAVYTLTKYLPEDKINSYISEVNQHLKESHESYKNNYYSMSDYPIDYSNEVGFVYKQVIGNKDFTTLEKYSNKYFIESPEIKNSDNYVYNFLEILFLKIKEFLRKLWF